MASRPSEPDSHPTSAFRGEAAAESPSPASPPPAEPELAEWPYRDVDPRTGRLRPISDEEWRVRMEESTRRLAEIDAEDDTPQEVYDEIMRNIDALHLPKDDASGSSLAEWPYRDVDPRTGRLRPISTEELQARYAELRKRLAEIDAEDETPDEVYDDVFRGIDEERRRQGRPPAFEGYY